MPLLEDDHFEAPVQGLLDERAGGRPLAPARTSALPSGFVTNEQVTHASKQKSIAAAKRAEINRDRQRYEDTEFKAFFDEVMTPPGSSQKSSDLYKSEEWSGHLDTWFQTQGNDEQ